MLSQPKATRFLFAQATHPMQHTQKQKAKKSIKNTATNKEQITVSGFGKHTTRKQQKSSQNVASEDR